MRAFLRRNRPPEDGVVRERRLYVARSEQQPVLVEKLGVRDDGKDRRTRLEPSGVEGVHQLGLLMRLGDICLLESHRVEASAIGKVAIAQGHDLFAIALFIRTGDVDRVIQMPEECRIDTLPVCSLLERRRFRRWILGACSV